MAKVLITGGSGFIGTHLVAALAGRGDEVTCWSAETSRVEPLRSGSAAGFRRRYRARQPGAGRCGPGRGVPRGRLLDGGHWRSSIA